MSHAAAEGSSSRHQTNGELGALPRPRPLTPHTFAPNWSLKAEYLCMNFGTIQSFNIDGETYDHRNGVHTAKLGLNYRFSGATSVVPSY